MLDAAHRCALRKDQHNSLPCRWFSVVLFLELLFRGGALMMRLSGLALLASLVLLLPLSLESQPPGSDRDAPSLEASGVPGCVGLVDGAAGGSSAAEATSASHGFDLANLDRSVS